VRYATNKQVIGCRVVGIVDIVGQHIVQELEWLVLLVWVLALGSLSVSLLAATCILWLRMDIHTELDRVEDTVVCIVGMELVEHRQGLVVLLEVLGQLVLLFLPFCWVETVMDQKVEVASLDYVLLKLEVLMLVRVLVGVTVSGGVGLKLVELLFVERVLGLVVLMQFPMTSFLMKFFFAHAHS